MWGSNAEPWDHDQIIIFNAYKCVRKKWFCTFISSFSLLLVTTFQMLIYYFIFFVFHIYTQFPLLVITSYILTIIFFNVTNIFTFFQSIYFNRSKISGDNSVTCMYLLEDENKIQVSVQIKGHIMLFSFLLGMSVLYHKSIKEEALN